MISWLFSLACSIIHKVVMSGISFILEPVKTVIIESVFLY